MIFGFAEGDGEVDRLVCLTVALWPILTSLFVYVRNVLWMLGLGAAVAWGSCSSSLTAADTGQTPDC